MQHPGPAVAPRFRAGLKLALMQDWPVRTGSWPSKLQENVQTFTKGQSQILNIYSPENTSQTGGTSEPLHTGCVSLLILDRVEVGEWKARVCP